MKYEQYVAHIKGLEAYALANPRLYEYKVLGLVLLGYAYFIALILLFLTIPLTTLLLLYIAPATVLRIGVQLWWLVLPLFAGVMGFLGGAVKAMFAPIPEPEGIPLDRSEAPELYQFINDTCKKLRAARPRKLLITDEFNASVATLPRIGIFGRQVHMSLGLPLMHTLTPEQFRAVLAHEIGHISEKHGRFAKWAYQVREAWGRFIESQEVNDHKVAFLYKNFVAWFFPYFTSYSFVLMREHEKEADRNSVQIVGRQPAGEALIALETCGSRLNEVFWKRVQERNALEAVAPKGLFSEMLVELRLRDEVHAANSLARVLEVPTDYHDSHPALADRLRSMGYWDGNGLPALPRHSERSAAEHYLRDAVPSLTEKLSNQWDENIGMVWKQRYDQIQKGHARVSEIESRAAEGGLTVEEMLERCELVAAEKGNEAALPLLREVLERYPDHADPHYYLGGVMVSIGDEAGLAHLQKAIDLDGKWRMAASDLAFQFLRSKGRFEEAAPYANAIEEEEERMERGNAERSGVSANDNFEPHSLPESVVSVVVSKLRYYDEVATVYLAKKVVEYRPDIPFHVLLISTEIAKIESGSQLKPSEILQIAFERLGDQPIDLFVLLDKQLDALVPKLEAIPGARIYAR